MGNKTGKCYSRIILLFSYNVFYSHLLARTSIQYSVTTGKIVLDSPGLHWQELHKDISKSNSKIAEGLLLEN